MADSDVQTESTPPPPPRSKRRWLQFGLRSVMLLTLVAAALCAWFTRPEWLTVHHAQGAVEIRSQVVRDEKQAPINRGKWRLYDEEKRERARGRYNGENPAGEWTYYHPSGKELLRDAWRDGGRQGLWVESYADGSHRMEAHYEKGLLEGEFNRWWPNGRLEIQGRHAADRREGLWVTWDEKGQMRSEGEYSAGQRDGTWRFWDARGKKLPSRRYAVGREVPANADKAIARWIEVLKSGTPVERGEAAWALGRIGSPAVPALLKSMSSSDREERAWAVAAAGSIARPNETTINALVARLDDREVMVRCAAAAALGKIGPAARAAIPGLHELAESLGAKNDVALAALASIDAAQQAPLRELLQKHAIDADKEVNSNGDLDLPLVPGDAASIAGLPAKEFFRAHLGLTPALVEATAGGDQRVAEQAALALGAIGQRHKSAIPALLEQLQAGDGWRRAAAARALGLLEANSDASIPEALEKVSLHDPDPNVRRSAKAALVRIPRGGYGSGFF